MNEKEGWENNDGRIIKGYFWWWNGWIYWVGFGNGMGWDKGSIKNKWFGIVWERVFVGKNYIVGKFIGRVCGGG